jgi:hypothetical protein
MSLRKKLIRLANRRPDLRPDLLPLLKKTAATRYKYEVWATDYFPSGVVGPQLVNDGKTSRWSEVEDMYVGQYPRWSSFEVSRDEVSLESKKAKFRDREQGSWSSEVQITIETSEEEWGEEELEEIEDLVGISPSSW